ncbi:hypothetical protein CAJAP_06927 [Camponotus japonicus]
MYISSINAFTACWLLLYSIKPLYSEAKKSYMGSYEINTMYQSEPVLLEKQVQSNVSKLPQYIYHRNYQSNSVQSQLSSMDMHHEAYVKENVAKSMPEYQLGYQETGKKNEEIMLKMEVLEKLLSEDTDRHDVESKNTVEDSIIAESIPEETKRVVRQVRRHRPGFFYTLARLAFETFNDTRSAIQQISNIIGENFEPDTTAQPPIVRSNPLQVHNATTVSTTSLSNDQNNLSSNVANVNVTTVNVTTTTTTTTTTTQAPFRFTRTGLQDLISRNLRGLMRLFNIEWQDALNQSDISVREFQRNLGNQIGTFLQDNPNAF